MKVRFSNTAKLPTKYGTFNIISFTDDTVNPKEHLVVFMGNLEHEEGVITRVHSECLTSDVFTSLKCDCGEQLDESLKTIANENKGMVIYLKQEGRGIGLFNKVNAYALQDNGEDTIQANHSLGFETDLRKFDIVSSVINYLKVKSIVLLTNNPEKIKTIEKSVNVLRVQPLIIEPNAFNKGYLEVKKNELSHLL